MQSSLFSFPSDGEHFSDKEKISQVICQMPILIYLFIFMEISSLAMREPTIVNEAKSFLPP